MREVKKVAIIGGGLIGMSWASLFLAHGLDVIVIDMPGFDSVYHLENAFSEPL